MSKKIPHGEEHLNCPLWQKPMSEVCHKCPWWFEIRGANPQTGEDVSDWNCAIAWGPMLALNIAQQARQTGAAVESFRNETVKGTREAQQFMAAALMNHHPQPPAILIEDKS